MYIEKDELLKIILTKTGVYCRSNFFKKSFPENYQEIESHHFPEHFTFSQKLYHYIYDVDCSHGKCKVCGNPTNFRGFGQGYSIYCSSSCLSKDDDFKQKMKIVWESYSDEEKDLINSKKSNWWNNLSDDEKNSVLSKREVTKKTKYPEEILKINNQIKETWHKKTRKELDIILNKRMTTLESRGEEYKEQIKEKHKEIWKNKTEEEMCIFKQNVSKSWWGKSESERNDISNRSRLSRLSKSDEEKNEIANKKYSTKKKNHSFNTSKIEEQVKQYLQNNNIIFIYQHKSDLYPFACDFYLPDYDLYIEINAHWTHGSHPFDKSNSDDVELSNLWKSKNKKFYDIAIDVWTQRDVKKRETAKKNNLKYLEIFSNDLDVVIKTLTEFIQTLK